MKILKTLGSSIFLLTIVLSLKGQDTANYKGELFVTDGQSLPIKLQIICMKDTTVIEMGSPSQTNKMFLASKSKINDDSVKFNIRDLGVKCRLKYLNGKEMLRGTFKQGLLDKTITFHRIQESFKWQRPQTPIPPFKYQIQELTFRNPNSEYIFHGTLTLPKQKGKFPIVVLVSGSGCQNRDEEILQHKPFGVIADYLTNKGIAVFRYDDRGFGSKDSNMYKATTMDLATDTRCAINMLKQQDCVDTNNIFVLGHSEGGMIAQILGANSTDLKALIFLATPSISGKEILLSQTKAILELNKTPQSTIDIALSEIENAKYDTTTINGLWLNYFYSFEPKKYLERISIPVLALQGGKDMQVIAKENMPKMRDYLKKINGKYILKEYKNLNHLFQDCNTGNPNEYGIIEQTISMEVLQDIKDFIFLWSK